MKPTEKQSCLTCRYNYGRDVEPGYDLVTCRAPWAVWNSNDMTGSDGGLLVQQPFVCSSWKRERAL